MVYGWRFIAVRRVATIYDDFAALMPLWPVFNWVIAC